MTNMIVNASSVTNSYGVYSSTSGTVKINHSVIKGTTNSIYNNSGVTTQVGNTQLDGVAVFNLGTLTCVGAYNTNYMAMTTACQ
jgi:hypothetical protein